jgi:hypothetical protein
LPLPYGIIVSVFPMLKLSGVPVRMMIITTLASAMICATALKWIFVPITKTKLLIALPLFLLLFVEYMPKPLPLTNLDIPPYIDFLKKLPKDYGLIDFMPDAGVALYYQTIHEKPMAFGYIARIPTSVHLKYQQFVRRINEVLRVAPTGSAEDIRLMQSIRDELILQLKKKYHIRYIVLPADINIISTYCAIKLVYRDRLVHIYDLGI